MHIYNMKDKELIVAYELSLKGRKYNLSLDDDMALLTIYNESFDRQDDSMNSHMYHHLVEFIREEMSDRFIELVNANK